MNHYKSALILMAALSLAACDKEDKSVGNDPTGDAIVTETVLDDVDSSEGTISDAMINVEGLDESTDAPEESENGESSDEDTEKKDRE